LKIPFYEALRRQKAFGYCMKISWIARREDACGSKQDANHNFRPVFNVTHEANITIHLPSTPSSTSLLVEVLRVQLNKLKLTGDWRLGGERGKRRGGIYFHPGDRA
jgi:hypothetical protein